MSSRLPATVNVSLEEFARHGGQTDRHRDGWGIAYYEGRGSRVFKEAAPASSSECVRFIEQQSYRSTTVISHIRYASHGRVAYVNTHPFARELGGRQHVFAHNGQLDSLDAQRGHFRPIGETDSELAFCGLLERLQPLWLQSTDGLPPLEQRIEAIARFATELRQAGPANFLYADGDALFAHADRRQHEPGSAIRPPGLHVLTRKCAASQHSIHSTGIKISSPDCGSQEQRAVLIASVPLTEEAWCPMEEGELLVARRGHVKSRVLRGPE